MTAIEHVRGAVKAHLAATAISIRQLERDAGLGNSVVAKLLNGAKDDIGLPVLERLASALGRSVAELIGEAPSGVRENGEAPSGVREGDEAPSGVRGSGEAPLAPPSGIVMLSPDELIASPLNPRKATALDAGAIADLARSIAEKGVLQNLIARPYRPLAAEALPPLIDLVANGLPLPDPLVPMFEIVAGERRWRAARQAGLAKVPCLVRDVDDRATVAMALIENIQREDLNPLEEANALRRLIDEFELTHQEVADAVGRSRAAVSNLLRLLELPAAIRTLVEAGSLDMGHARALLTLPEPQAVRLAEQAAAEGWSVRQLEQAARQAPAPGKTAGRPAPARPDPDISRLEQELAERLCAPVSIRHGRAGKGQVVIRYHSLDELDGVLERLRRD